MTSYARPEASLVVPVHDAGVFLDRTLHEILTWLDARDESWELIVVDDASTDTSRDIVERFRARSWRTSVSLLALPSNRGKGFAVRTGIAAARAPYVVFTDCDLAYPMSNVPRVLEALAAGADVAIASRVMPGSTYLISPSFFSYLYTRHVMGRLFNRVARLMTVPGVSDTQAGLKGFRTASVRPLLSSLVLDRFSFDVELLRALQDRGAILESIPVTFRYDSEPTTVRFVADSLRMLRDLARMRLRSIRGVYRAATEPPPVRVVVNADDFGLAPGVNRAIAESLASGAVDRASILAGTEHADEALAWAAMHPTYEFGVHLNLTLGRPVSPPDAVPTLVDRRGRFLPLPRFVARLAAGRVRFGEILREWEAQIARVREAGVRIGHLDSHQHVHLLPGIARRAALPLARRHGLPIRGMDGPVRGTAGLPDPKALALALATRRARRTAATAEMPLHGFGASWRRTPSLDRIRDSLARLEGRESYELVVHPGYVDDALRASGDRYLDGREIERALLASDGMRALLHGTPG